MSSSVEKQHLSTDEQTVATRNGGVSFWWQQIGLPKIRRRLPGPIDVDVAIVGAGYTGLWTAYYLKLQQPDIRIAVIEAKFAGFGASGRNGGWLTNSVTGGKEYYAALKGRDAAIRLQRALNDSVNEVISVAKTEHIEADIVKGGELTIARSNAQFTRLIATAKAEASWPDTNIEVLDVNSASARIAVPGVLGGMWHPHCARLHPAKLASGLAETVEKLGVFIYENTRVLEIVPNQAITQYGTVRAQHVIRATEGFTPELKGEHRTWLPMNSSMIVTEPLPADVWQKIGWSGNETLGDSAHVYMYAQRTADNRIAFGGRGVPYRFGSRVDNNGNTQAITIRVLTELLDRFFPAISGSRIDHAWAGVLGVPRNWAAGVDYDPRTGLGWAGGYVGTGVTATNLAGRTLSDLVLGRETDLVDLPWVGNSSKRWETEPFRWLAVHGIYRAYGMADNRENKGGPTSWYARVADRIAGR